MNAISLKYRIALTIFILEAVMLTLVLWRVQTVSYNRVTSSLHERHAIYLDLLADRGRDALVTTEYGELQNYVDRLNSVAVINTIFMTDHRKIIVVSSEPALLSKTLPSLKDDASGHWDTRNIALESAGGNIGSIYIKFSNDRVRAAYRESIFQGILIAGFSMTAIAVAGILLGSLLVKRLELLHASARKMAEGNLDIQADISGSDEVSRLARAFNAMAQTIKVSMEALRVSEARFREITDNMVDMVAQFDEKAFYQYVSPSYEKLLGYRPEELTGTWAPALLHPDDRDTAIQAIDSMLRSDSDKVAFRFRHKNGTYRWIESTGRNITNAQGRVLGSVMGSRDITDRKRTEEALQVSERRYHQLFENMQEGFMIQDIVEDDAGKPIDVRYLDINPAIERFLGKTRAEIVGKTRNEVLGIPDPAVVEANSRVVATGQSFHMMRYSSGAKRWYESFSYSFGPGQVATLVRDITERKQAEEQVLRSLKEKEVLLQEVHHRVKNNMQVIYSLLNLQAKAVTDRTVRAMFEESRNRVNSMALIHEKLYHSTDLAHVEFKEYLQSLVYGIADTYKRHDIAVTVDMKNIALDVNVGIPCGLIVNELVSNSFKHAFPAGGKGTIRVGLCKNGDGNYVLSVEDNGIGLPEEVDFRNTSSLGLQLVNVLAGQIHGTIALSKTESNRFSITFPGTPENKGARNE